MYPEDVIVVLYPNKERLESVIVIDPLDKKVLFHPVDSIGEAKEFLKGSLPFCYQHDVPQIHFGSVFIIEWESLSSSKVEVRKPEDIDKVLS
jgi:hypothetical protein